MNTARSPIEANRLRQVPAGLAWAVERGLILKDHQFYPDKHAFVFRPNAYGLQWVPGQEFRQARPVFGQRFVATLGPDDGDFVFAVLDGPSPLSPNILGPFVCLRPPRRDGLGGPRLGLMIQTLVWAYSLHKVEWSPPFNPKVAEWLWQHRDEWVPVPQPAIAWAQSWQKGGAGA